jgi:hypothetical protein
MRQLGPQLCKTGCLNNLCGSAYVAVLKSNVKWGKLRCGLFIRNKNPRHFLTKHDVLALKYLLQITHLHLSNFVWIDKVKIGSFSFYAKQSNLFHSVTTEATVLNMWAAAVTQIQTSCLSLILYIEIVHIPYKEKIF